MSLISQNKVKIEGGMSSMTDLVFLLLIFFIILSALAKNAVEEVELPKGGAPDVSTKSLAAVVVKSDNSIVLNGKEVPIENIGFEMSKAVEDDKDKKVELYGDISSDYGVVVKVIDAAKKNKLRIILMSKK